jgi:hypothetical protein
MARFGVGLDTEERAGTLDWQLSHNHAEIDAIEDLARVALAIRGCELDPGAFSYTATSVLGVLEPAQLGTRRQLAMVAILDLHAAKRTLKPQRVGPCVLAAPHASALANVQQQTHISGSERPQERVEIPLIDADRAGPLHLRRHRQTVGPDPDRRSHRSSAATNHSQHFARLAHQQFAAAGPVGANPIARRAIWIEPERSDAKSQSSRRPARRV